jgi:transaldolase
MIELYADGADLDGIKAAAENKKISGFTTNPTLMRQAGVTDYKDFAIRTIMFLQDNRPETNLSLEVFADDEETMYAQAKEIDSWAKPYGYDVYIKIPVTNTKSEPTYNLIKRLSDEGVKVNVTAVFTYEQSCAVVDALNIETPSIISIFAGRIADAGIDPVPLVTKCMEYYDNLKTRQSKVKFLWASSREAFNYHHANSCGCDIITMTPDLIKKVSGFGKDLTQFSLETVKMFYNDAKASGFTIDVSE